MTQWKYLLDQGRRITRNSTFEIIVVMIVAIIAAVTFYYDVAFDNKTLLTPGMTAGVMGDSGPYGLNADVANLWKNYGRFFKDLGSVAWAGEPQSIKSASLIRQLVLPLWNDNVGLGKPLAANFLSNPFFPLKLIIYASPNVFGWDMYLIARFAVGVFFMTLFLRLQRLNLFAAIVGGIIFAFSGFFILLQNIQDLDVGFLVPMMFWVVAYTISLAENNSIRPWPYIALVAGLITIFLSNIPEPLILVLAAGFAYWGYRLIVLFQEKDRVIFRRAIVFSLQIIVPTILIVLPQYLINWEFVTNSFNTHEKDAKMGLSIWYQIRSAGTNILPYIHNYPFWEPSAPAAPNTLNYIGLVGFFLLIIGAIKALATRRTWLFILILAIITFAKVYGVHGIHQILGSIPGFDRVIFPKYAQSIFSFGLASLAALGLHSIIEKQLSIKQYLASLLVMTILLSWGVWYLLPTPKMGWVVDLNSQIPSSIANLVLIVFIGFGLAFAGFILVYFNLRSTARWVLGGLIGLLVMAELWSYIPRTARPERYESFTKAPFVNFLQTKEGPYRIFGLNRLLYPQISSAFNLDDIRDLDGLYVEHYYDYIKTFISPSIQDRFTGASEGEKESKPINFIKNPLFNLLGVKYILAVDPPLQLFAPNKINDLIFANNTVTPSIREFSFVIDNQPKRLFFEHAPAKTCVPLRVSKDEPVLRFSLGIAPQAWTYPNADGVNFILTDSSNKSLFFASLNPQRLEADRHWHDYAVDLSRFANKTESICFITEPQGNTLVDMAGWADLRLTAKTEIDTSTNNEQYKLIYNDDILIYENAEALTRGFLVGEISTVSRKDDAIIQMNSTSFDPKRRAIVMTKKNQPTPPALGGEKCANNTISNYQERNPTNATFNITSSATCLLVWTDTYYPGWIAKVDGKKQPIYQTDLMFRGLVLTEGSHTVEFNYRPLSFYGGLIGSLVGFVIVAGCVRKINRQH